VRKKRKRNERRASSEIEIAEITSFNPRRAPILARLPSTCLFPDPVAISAAPLFPPVTRPRDPAVFHHPAAGTPMIIA